MPGLGASGTAAGESAPAWPRVIKAGGDTTISVYLPQLDSWDGNRLEAHSAVSVQTGPSVATVFGVVPFLLEQSIPPRIRTIELDRLDAALEMREAQAKGKPTVKGVPAVHGSVAAPSEGGG